MLRFMGSQRVRQDLVTEQQRRRGACRENRPNPTDCLTTDQDSTAAGKATDQPLQISTSGTWTERHPTNGWTESIETAGPHPTSPTALGEEPVRWRAAPHDTAVTWFSPTTPLKASSTGLSQMEPVSKSLPWGLVRHSWNLHINWRFLKV